MKKKNIFNGFLIFVLFFNFLFFSIEDVFALSQETVVGPRDRIRKFEELNFKYIAPEPEGGNLDIAGFSCKPGELKFFEPNENLGTIGGSELERKIAAGAYDVIVNIFLFPVLCISVLNTAGKIAKDDNNPLISGLSIFAELLLLKGLEELEDLIFDEDDYNLDPYNTYCSVANITMMSLCLAMFLVFKIRLKKIPKILIILGISLIMYVAKSVFKGKQYKKANEVFDNLSLCGDNWLTYGSNEIEDAIGGRTILRENEKNAWNQYIITSFPVKGVFLGSYKYKLNKCFTEKNIMFCRNIFNDQSMTSSDVDIKTSMSFKQYREFLYGGMEYSYDGCKDPRTTRKTYLSTNNSDSQLYYFRGSEAANFACDRFLENASKEYREAYDCCLKASQKLICISDNKQRIHVMCDKESKPGDCKISGNYNIVENSAYNNDNFCSDFKKLLEERKNDICSEYKDKDGKKDCPEVIDTYSEICDENGKVRNEQKSEVQAVESDTIKFKIVKSANDNFGTKYCVETYNFCPYNFRLLGGTEKYGMDFSPSYKSGFKVKEENKIYVQDTDREVYINFNKKNNCTFDEKGNRHCLGPCYNKEETEACFGKASNFCQVDRHCVKIPEIEKIEKYYTSPYIDDACINNVGSSHNFDNYIPNISTASKSTKLLTAPLVECTVETFKNILMNRAGHTTCINLNEVPINNKCMNSGALYIKGQELTQAGYNSSFKKIKYYFIGLVKAIMALAVLLYGYNIIIFKKGVTPEEIMKFILTMTFVSYFTLSNNWIPYIFDNIYRVYNRVAEFAVEILSEAEKNDKDPYKDPKYSGCFFLNKNNINNNYNLYGDRKYIAIFDTFDCKFGRYIGYSDNEATIPSIIVILVVGVLTFGLSILMILPFILLFVSLLYFIIRIAYIFIVNSLTITILLFMSPIFIPMILFERTKGMFKSWITKILQSVISPLFIFMSLSMFFVIFDKYYFADAEFFGNREPYRDMYCGSLCKIDDNNSFYITESKNSDYAEECNRSGGKIIELLYSSPACFVSQILNKQYDSGNNIANFFIRNSSWVVPSIIALTKDNDFGKLMSTVFGVIFLVVIIFLFEQMISYVNSMTSVIFGSESGGYSGVDDTASGLPTLQQTLGAVANAGAELANSTKNVPKAVINHGVNKVLGLFDKASGNTAEREAGQTESNSESNDNEKNDSNKEDEEENENK